MWHMKHVLIFSHPNWVKKSQSLGAASKRQGVPQLGSPSFGPIPTQLLRRPMVGAVTRWMDLYYGMLYSTV